MKVQGDNTAANVRRWVKEGLDVCARLNCSRVLVEEYLEGRSLGVSETFWVVEEGCRAARMLITHMAYVDANPEHKKEMVAFAEMVARNRAVNVRVFCQVREAEARFD